MVDGKQILSTDMRRISRYVYQHDVFIGTLTVREQLTYSVLFIFHLSKPFCTSKQEGASKLLRIHLWVVELDE